jgi:hypothetical protein
MTRRDWWFGILVLTLAMLAHAAFPRYEWRQTPAGLGYVRIDRWTGTADLGSFTGGAWTSTADTERTRRQAAAAAERRRESFQRDLDAVRQTQPAEDNRTITVPLSEVTPVK